ncbi:M66 family metalloprotease [Pseudomonas sp. GD04058]|uniref:M66 family metalloprotease n=1 Tax=Pseudomonas sp. GD04058 TaxID=2975429 RepID=UPI0024491E62|nr:M66 family metalloprotease [Pseudomonas sp. GD04058]MDG9882459.1 M66 family metalloprotease [Pseudomonas sp. GD04058]
MSSSQSPLYFNDRELGNDLVGELKGSVLFAQVSVLPSRSSPIAGDVQPRLTGLRDTLVMFKPVSVIDAAEGIQLSVGNFTLAMAPPEQLPPIAERDSDAEYGRIVYGENFWSAVLPWQHVVAGMDLVFRAGASSGTFADADVGAPGEMLVNTIDIGMLTPNRRKFTDEFITQLHREYFQTLPCSRLIVNQYEPMHFQFIEMADGTLYLERSQDEGTWHAGDLRQRIGKELVCLGINNASQGIHSSPGSGESGLNKHMVIALVTAHTSVGNYRNGVVMHGGSGGGGMVTLGYIASNELSHEFGHHYGLSHHPGGFAGSVHRAARGTNSAWGWDSDKNVFVPNFLKSRSGEDTCQSGTCEPPFHGHPFGRDSMSSGYAHYPSVNRYTQFTPWSLKTIQSYLENNAIFSTTSTTGHLKWNEQQKAMLQWGELHRAGVDELDLASMTELLKRFKRIEVDLGEGHWAADIHLPATTDRLRGVRILSTAAADSVLHVNGTRVTVKKGDFLNYEMDGTWTRVEDFSVNVAGQPEQVGVPVTTVLGYYDPELGRAGIIYPALHCAWGMTYPGVPEEISLKLHAYAMVTNAQDERLYFPLRNSRVNPGELNRLHLNIPQAFKATYIAVYCADTQNASRGIDPPEGIARVTFTGRD